MAVLVWPKRGPPASQFVARNSLSPPLALSALPSVKCQVWVCPLLRRVAAGDPDLCRAGCAVLLARLDSHLRCSQHRPSREKERFVSTHNPVLTTVDMKAAVRGHLDGLGQEISSLMESSKPESKTILASWTKNCDEIDVALKVILAASQSIHDGVTRLNLVYKADPSEAASESMSKEIGGFCQQMVASLTLLSSVGASKAMVDYFSIGVRAILHSVKDLIEALLDPSRHAHLNGVTGMVWQSCKELQQAPKTNKLACRRQMMQWSVSIKDTIDEFVEAAKTAALANAGNRDAPRDTTELDEQFAAKVTVGGKESGEEGGGGFDDLDFDDMDEDYSTAELQCVQASIDILRVFRRCLKVANESFNSLDSAQSKAAEGGAAAGASREGWLKAKLEWAKSVQRHLEDANECAGEVGILLYPPLAGGELLGRANDLEKSILGFCDVFFAGDEGRGEGGESPLRKTVGVKVGALRAAVEAL